MFYQLRKDKYNLKVKKVKTVICFTVEAQRNHENTSLL